MSLLEDGKLSTTVDDLAAVAAHDPARLRPGGASTESADTRLLPLYYRVKPVIPRRAQLGLRRLYSRRQAGRSFPAWPIEPILVEHQHERFRKRIRAAGGRAVPFPNFWPGGHRFALTLTHDVEAPAGVENVLPLMELERRYGLAGSWNFVGEGYPLPEGLFDALRAAGCEIGLHGLVHDRSLFKSRKHFDRQLPRIHRLLEEWNAVGFRSPATYRNADWMPMLGCSYDSSFPDTDPFEPQPGGCCSIFPFFLRDLVEVPITMPQDHTLFEILREPSNRIWYDKAEWIVRHHGLITVLVHPDYIITDERLERYEQLLAFLAAQQNGWHALPREVAAWWRARRALETGTGEERAPAPEEYRHGRPTTAYAREEHGQIIFES